MWYSYLEILKAENEICEYIEGKKPEKDLHNLFEPIDFYLDNEAQFSKEESIGIEKGLARIALVYMKGYLKKR